MSGILCGGCGQEIESLEQVYRCVDCNTPYHQGCLKSHCGGRMELVEAENERLRQQIGQVIGYYARCQDPTLTKFSATISENLELWTLVRGLPELLRTWARLHNLERSLTIENYIHKQILSIPFRGGRKTSTPTTRYPETVKRIVRQRWGLEADDTSRDEDIAGLGPDQAFAEVCRWELGGTGWALQILEWLTSCGYVVIGGRS